MTTIEVKIRPGDERIPRFCPPKGAVSWENWERLDAGHVNLTVGDDQVDDLTGTLDDLKVEWRVV
jgi:hypothetical protein